MARLRQLLAGHGQACRRRTAWLTSHSHGTCRRLKLPAGVERDDPLLFLGDGEFVDVVEQLMGVDPSEAAAAFAGASHGAGGGGLLGVDTVAVDAEWAPGVGCNRADCWLVAVWC